MNSSANLSSYDTVMKIPIMTFASNAIMHTQGCQATILPMHVHQYMSGLYLLYPCTC
jgi:hypothetical protein